MQIEPTTAVGTGLAILGSKDILLKLLGPTADYVGGEIQGLVAKCNINLDNIFKKAFRKLGDRADQAGEVNPRVLKHVMDEGRFCEDELTAEYYGGILASAKSRNGRDDRGVTVLSAVKDLSVYQLRTHFIIYSVVHRLFKGKDWNLADNGECNTHRIWIPYDVYVPAMAFQEGEDANSIVSHALFGLARHDLIRDFVFGPPEFLKAQNPHIPAAGIIITPTLPGAEMFLWALGLQGASGSELFRVEVQGELEGVSISDGASPVKDLKPKLVEPNPQSTGT